MGGTAELTEAVFKLRLAERGRVDADFVLTVRTPDGRVEHWGFGWNLQDVLLEPARGRSLRELFDPFMRSLYDDHLYDLAERRLTPDRTYDERRSGWKCPTRSSDASSSARVLLRGSRDSGCGSALTVAWRRER